MCKVGNFKGFTGLKEIKVLRKIAVESPGNYEN